MTFDEYSKAFRTESRTTTGKLLCSMGCDAELNDEEKFQLLEMAGNIICSNAP